VIALRPFRSSSRVSAAILGAVVVCWGAGAAPRVVLAQSEVTVVRIEEDWVLAVATPDPNATAPQVSCAISPTGDATSLFAVFELNHQSIPSFVPGGLQLQIWNGDEPIASHMYPQDSVMETDGEVVRWTQTMTLANGQLTFEVVSGESTTWGEFGGQGYLKHTTTTELAGLNAYDPAVSVANSAVGFAGNRVTVLALERVRYVLSTGLVVEDSQARLVGSAP